MESPLSDFFGLGFGEWRDYVSRPSSATSGVGDHLTLTIEAPEAKEYELEGYFTSRATTETCASCSRSGGWGS